MEKTRSTEVEGTPILMTMENFISYVGAGRHTANQLIIQAEAKVYIGRRVLVNMDRVKSYVDSISQ
ncbi:MAG: hypothetical protein E7256_06710 [Lachnospiraceae bacterium]|nr:hypothetical protein [Lachnospiraceae bacterium]